MLVGIYFNNLEIRRERSELNEIRYWGFNNWDITKNPVKGGVLQRPTRRALETIPSTPRTTWTFICPWWANGAAQNVQPLARACAVDYYVRRVRAFTDINLSRQKLLIKSMLNISFLQTDVGNLHSGHIRVTGAHAAGSSVLNAARTVLLSWLCTWPH